MAATRTTISLPEDLFERMQKFRREVKWSQVAQQAFRAKIFELEGNEKNSSTELTRSAFSKIHDCLVYIERQVETDKELLQMFGAAT